MTKLTPKLPKNSTVKVIGLGGVGAIIARYSGLFLSSPSLNEDSRLVLIDGDFYEPKNACRMLFKDYGNKAEVMKSELLEYLEDSRVSIEAIPEYVTTKNVRKLILEGDIVFLAVDNHKTRKLVNDHCSILKNIVLISAGNDPQGKDSAGKELRGSYGNSQIYIRKDAKDFTNSLTRWHPEIANPKDDLPTEQNCTAMMTSVPQILFANLQAATSALLAFYRHIANGPIFGEVSFDIIDAKMNPLPYPGPDNKEWINVGERKITE